MMALREQLNDAMKEAMKAKDAQAPGTLRLMLAGIKDRDIAARTETSRDRLGDDDILRPARQDDQAARGIRDRL